MDYGRYLWPALELAQVGCYLVGTDRPSIQIESVRWRGKTLGHVQLH